MENEPFQSENSCSDYEYPYETCDRSAQDLGALLMLGGIAGMTVGTIQSIIRGAKRRNLARQITTRQSEAAALRGLHPTWGLAPTRGGGGTLTLALDF